MLESACVGHNYFAFYRDAMEVCLKQGDWDGASRYASALENYCRQEPIPWSEFFIARGRALAEFGREGHGGEMIGELGRLRDQAVRAGLNVAKRPLEKALEAALARG